MSKNILDRISELLDKGFSRSELRQELGLESIETEKLIAKSKAQQLIDTMPGLLERVIELREVGIKKDAIHQHVNCETREIGRALATIADTLNPPPEKISKKKKPKRIDEIREMLEENYDTYDIAKRFELGPLKVNNYLRQVNGTHSPVDDWVKKASKYGVALSTLSTILGFKDLDKAIEVLKYNFPGCYISQIKDGEDLLLTPIPDSSGIIEKANIDVSKRKDLFEYFVHPMGNYMYVKFNDNLPGDTIKIYNFSDIHLGSNACRTPLLLEHLEMVKEDGMSFAQLGGDLVENSSKQSVGSEADQYLRPSDQVSLSIETFGPLAFKTIDSVEGNHEERSERFSGIDISQHIAECLKLPHFTQGIFVHYEWRGIRKLQFHTHRYKNSYTKPAIEAQVRKMLQKRSYHVDWFSSGHTHEAYWYPIESEVLVPGRGFEVDDTFIVNAGSYTGDVGTYSQEYGRSPKDLTYISLREDGVHGAGSIRIKSI